MPEPVQILNFSGGLDQSLPHDQIQLTASPALQNFTILDGIAQKRKGYKAVTGTNTFGTAEKPFLAGRHYGDSFSGKKRFWAITKAHAVQKEVLSSGNWNDGNSSGMNFQAGDDQYVSLAECVDRDDYKNYLLVCQNHTDPLTALNGTLPGSLHVTGATATDVDPSVVTSTGSFAGYTLAGISVYISGTNITAGWYEIDSHDNNALTMLENICDGGAGSAVVVKGIEAATDESTVWYTSAPDGTLAKLGGALGYNDATGGDYHRAKQVINFQGSVFLLHTYERVNATEWASLSYRVRWSDQYKFGGKSDDSDNDKQAAWDPDGTYDDSTTSLAGWWDARLGYGAILRGAKLRNTLVIFLEEAIALGVQTTNYTSLFTFRTRVPQIGLYAPRLLIEVGDRLCFVGSDREIYQYFGGADPDPIGAKIRSEFFNDIQKGESGGYLIRNRSFGVHLTDIHAVGFFIPVNSNYPDVGWLYFYRENRWERIVLPTSQYFCGTGEWQRPAGVVAENVPIVGDESGVIYQWDYDHVNDISAAIDAWIQTPDIQISPKHRQEVTEVWFEASGDGAASRVQVAVSTDAGANWSGEETQTITAGWASYRVIFTNQGGYRFRLRFRNNITSEKLLLGRIWTEPAAGGEEVA